MTTRVNPRLLALQQLSMAGGLGEEQDAANMALRDEDALRALDVSGVQAAPMSVPAYRPIQAPSTPEAPAPMVDESMQRAEEADRNARLLRGLAMAGERMGAAFAGTGPDFSSINAIAGEPGGVRGLLAKRQALAEAAAAERKARMADPSSPESKRFQQSVRAVLPGAVSDDALAYLSAEDEPLLFKGVELSAAAQRRMEDAERRKADRLAADERAKAGRAFQEKENRLKRENDLKAAAVASGDKALQEELKRQEDVAKRVEQQTADFGKLFTDSGAPEFYTQFNKASAVMEKYKDDLPGYGFAAGRLPDRATSDDGIVLRQSIGQMLASYQKMITGSGASDAERQNLNKITGLLESNDERSVRLGVSMLKEAMDNKVASLSAGYRPDVVERYAARAPSFPAKARPKAAPQAAQNSRPPPPEGKVYVEFPGRGVKIIPFEKLNEARTKYGAREVK